MVQNLRESSRTTLRQKPAQAQPSRRRSKDYYDSQVEFSSDAIQGRRARQ
jgi:hypothetical protein